MTINVNPRTQNHARFMLRPIRRKNEKELSAFSGTDWKVNKNESVLMPHKKPIRQGTK